MKNYTDHGRSHSERLIEIIKEILEVCRKNSIDFNDIEESLLFAAAWLHDIGCLISREEHSKKSIELLRKYNGKYFTGVKDELRTHLEWIIRAHQKDQNIDDVPETVRYHGNLIKLRFLSALFRLADACDIDERRAPKVVYDIIKGELSGKSKEVWAAHSMIESLCFDFEEKSMTLHVKDRDSIKIIIDSLNEELKSINHVLLKYCFPCLLIKTINIRTVPIDVDSISI